MIEAKVERIGHSEAVILLRNNLSNRSISQSVVDQYAAQMGRGEWRLNGETILVAEGGRLLNGQHRLHAVMKSKSQIEVLVVRGLPPDIFDTIDRGRKRTVGDVLSIRGEKDYNALAAAAKLLFMWRAFGNPVDMNQRHFPSATQIVETIENNSSLRDHVTWAARSKWSRKYVGVGLAGFCRLAFMEADYEAGFAFFDDLESGANLAAKSPPLVLRDRLSAPASSTHKMTRLYRTALIFKAFRFYRDGASVGTLRVIMDGERKETDYFVL